MSGCLAQPCRNPPGSVPQSCRTVKELQSQTCSPVVLAPLTNTPHPPGPCALKEVDFEGSQTHCKTNQITSVRQMGLGFSESLQLWPCLGGKKKTPGSPLEGIQPSVGHFQSFLLLSLAKLQSRYPGQKMCRFDQVKVLVFRIIPSCLIWSYKLAQNVTTLLLCLQYGICSADPLSLNLSMFWECNSLGLVQSLRNQVNTQSCLSKEDRQSPDS